MLSLQNNVSTAFLGKRVTVGGHRSTETQTKLTEKKKIKLFKIVFTKLLDALHT